MISLLSPAKTLDFETPSKTSVCTQPEFLNLTSDLIKGLSKLKAEEVANLMNISPKLADLNRKRFQKWKSKHDQENAKQAILAFKGDVYEGLRAGIQQVRLTYAQKHLRVLSGLYGILKPRPDPTLTFENGHNLFQSQRQRSICFLGGQLSQANQSGPK